MEIMIYKRHKYISRKYISKQIRLKSHGKNWKTPGRTTRQVQNYLSNLITFFWLPSI